MSRPMLYGTLALITLALGGAMALQAATFAQTEALRAELAGFLLPSTVTARDIPARELGLYHYYTSVRLDPIFDTTGIEVGELRKAIDALEHNRILSLDALPEEDAEIVAPALYPLGFLRAFLALAERQARFLEAPSETTAANYHDALVETLAAYDADAATLAESLARFEKERLAFWMGTTSPAFVAGELESVRKQMRAAGKKESARFACLEGKYRACPFLRGIFGAPAEDANLAHDTPSPSAELNRRLVQSYFQGGETRPSFSKTPDGVSEIPIILVERSRCVPQEDPIAYTLWWSRSRVSGIDAMWATPVNDLLFHDLAETAGAYFEALHDAGIRYKYQTLNLYLCAEAGPEIAEVATAYAIQLTVRGAPIFALLHEQFSDVAQLEARLARAPNGLVSSSLVSRYVSEIERILGKETEAALAELIGEERVYRAEHIRALWKNKNAWFADIVGSIDDMALSTIEVSSYQRMHPDKLLLTRSYPTVLLMFANETVVPEPPPLIEEPETYTDAEPWYRRFRLKGYPRELAVEIGPTFEEAARSMADMAHRINKVLHPQLISR